MKYKTHDEHCLKYGELCNFFWFLLKPDWEPDGFLHTSDECRRLAGEVFDLLGVGGYEKETRQHVERHAGGFAKYLQRWEGK